MGTVQPGLPRDLALYLRDTFGLADFIETGTFLGDTAAWAAGAFARATTIEAAASLHARAAARHGHLKNLRLVLGDSRAELPRMLASAERPALLWLDGHWSDGETFGQGAECPLADELRAVTASRVEHFVLIDDARLFLSPPPPPHDPRQWPTMPQIVEMLRAGGRDPYVVVVDDVIIAVPASARAKVSQFLRTLPAAPAAALARLESLGLRRAGQPLRLHLGCGEQRIDGTIGIDHPPSEHAVMNVAADVFADIVSLDLPDECVDEIRLHHVFEHFSRVTALGLLLRWHRWLKPGGQLRIETPDVMGSARTLLSSASLKTKLGVIRHLAGDQSSPWAYHVDQWFAERFEHTLGRLGYTDVKARQWAWQNEPFLSNVEVTATKRERVAAEKQIAAAEELLWDATVAAAERPTWEVWRRQLRAFVGEGRATRVGVSAGAGASAGAGDAIAALLAKGASSKPIAEIHDFNQRGRDRWVAEKARSIPAGARVLDVGAGTCPYKPLLAHCRYEAHDFKRYDGVKLGGSSDYGQIDHASDITQIPVPDGTFDVVLCTEVLEHVPEPIDAIREMIRVVRPGGRILLTAPLGSGLHQLPYHFYGGYTPEWYRRCAERFGLEVKEITPNGGFFKLLAQECARVAWMLPQHAAAYGSDAPLVARLFGELLPRYLYALEDKCFVDQFTAGYHVELAKPVATAVAGDERPLAPRAGAKLTGIVFSKDRPLQLDAVLRSFAAQCVDAGSVSLQVLYACSSSAYEKAYEQLASVHAGVTFVRERDFRGDLSDMISAAAEAVLFLVDDTLFVRPFSVSAALAELDRHPDALGFSLRLGKNTTYCYPLDRPQRTPAFQEPSAGVLKFAWTAGEGDFAYPLEVSSSIFRAGDILPLLSWLPFRHPNSLEEVLAQQASLFRDARPALLCFDRSVAFAAPINRVQSTHANRAADDDARSAGALLGAFEEGKRIDVAAYAGFVPNACHQEVPVRFAGEAPAQTKTVEPYEARIRAVEGMLEQGKTAQAISSLEGYLADATGHAAASHDLAVLYCAVGRRAEARQLLEGAAARNPGHPLLTQALAAVPA
jgi:ubiquinone/menaquinone biosynthesis C-methylase UbiE